MDSKLERFEVACSMWELLAQQPDDYNLVRSSLEAPNGFLHKKLRVCPDMQKQLVECKLVDTIRRTLGTECDSTSVQAFLNDFIPFRVKADGIATDASEASPFAFDATQPRLSTLTLPLNDRCKFASDLYVSRVLKPQVARHHMGAHVLMKVSGGIQDAYQRYVEGLTSEEEVNALPASVDELQSICAAVCSIADSATLKPDFLNVAGLQKDFDEDKDSLMANVVITMKASPSFFHEYLDLTENKDQYKTTYKAARDLDAKMMRASVRPDEDLTDYELPATELVSSLVTELMALDGKIRKAAFISLEKRFVEMLSGLLGVVKQKVSEHANLPAWQELAEKAQACAIPQAKELRSFKTWAEGVYRAAQGLEKGLAVSEALEALEKEEPQAWTKAHGESLKSSVQELAKFGVKVATTDMATRLTGIITTMMQRHIPDCEYIHDSVTYAARFAFGDEGHWVLLADTLQSSAWARARMKDVQALGPNAKKIVEANDYITKVDVLIRAKIDLAECIAALGSTQLGDHIEMIRNRTIEMCNDIGKEVCKVEAEKVGYDTMNAQRLLFNDQGHRWDHGVKESDSFEKLMTVAGKTVLTRPPSEYFDMAEKITSGYATLADAASRFEQVIPEAVVKTKNKIIEEANLCHIEGLLLSLPSVELSARKRCGKVKAIKAKLRSLNGAEAFDSLHQALKDKAAKWERMEEDDD